MLDRLGALLLAGVFALLAWRTTDGALSAWTGHTESQILGFPEWVVHATMVPPFILTALIGLWQAAFGLGDAPEAHA